ncbi:MAG: 50S ribosomal protein L15 [Deltaproteobacteria bacterium]|jgi:large subunit ribosomal protein L15|nr:50S ribosomal protein L15 [Deltaproteobacteria bacterium]
MQLHDLYPFAAERKKRKRIGRGSGSGWGMSAGKGGNGQKQRSGGAKGPAFEGGQMPLQRRLPKHGFTNIFKTAYQVVNLDQLIKAFAGRESISLEDIYARGLAKPGSAVKVLGNGDVAFGLKIEAHKFSAAAKEKIEKAGGSVNALEG